MHVLAKGQVPHTRHVRGSNYNLISVFEDRLAGRAIIVSGDTLVLVGLTLTVCSAFQSFLQSRAKSECGKFRSLLSVRL